MAAAAPEPPRKHDRSRRAELQRMLGDHGTVLPRQHHGTLQRPAQGWYARLPPTGKLVFLGDYTMLAALKIRKLLDDTHT